MKKIYLSIIAIGFILSANAQLSLTKAFNEPILGDVVTRQGYDSIATIPKNSGAGQLWDFSALTSNTVVSINTYTTVSSTPNGASFSSATLASDDGQGGYTYTKSTATQFEIVGIVDPNITLSFTNSAIAAIWPVTMSYTNTDTFGGSASSGTMTGTSSGTINTGALGTGTLIIPGGATFTNVLQVKAKQNVKVSLVFGLVTATVVSTGYDYYHGSQKFPLLSVNYTNISGAFTSSSATIKVNNAVITGINDLNFDASFAIYPNPAKENFNVKLDNASNANCFIEIFNSFGNIAQSNNLGTDSTISKSVSISNLATGIYFVKTNLGDKVSIRKLIVE